MPGPSQPGVEACNRQTELPTSAPGDLARNAKTWLCFLITCVTLGKSLSLSGSHLASVDNREENMALPTSWGCISRPKGSKIYEKDLERVEYQKKSY